MKNKVLIFCLMICFVLLSVCNTVAFAEDSDDNFDEIDIYSTRVKRIHKCSHCDESCKTKSNQFHDEVIKQYKEYGNSVKYDFERFEKWIAWLTIT